MRSWKPNFKAAIKLYFTIADKDMFLWLFNQIDLVFIFRFMYLVKSHGSTRNVFSEDSFYIVFSFCLLMFDKDLIRKDHQRFMRKQIIHLRIVSNNTTQVCIIITKNVCA